MKMKSWQPDISTFEDAYYKVKYDYTVKRLNPANCPGCLKAKKMGDDVECLLHYKIR